MRIVTYNTRGSLGMDGRFSTPRIIEVVRSLTPDIVCFQEIHQRMRRSGGEDQPANLETGLGRRFHFQPNLRFGFSNYGIGIAQRGVFIAKQAHFLPGGREQRGALEVSLRDVAGIRRLTIFCTHWGLTPEERLAQAETLAQIVRAAKDPVVLCGDLNEPPEGPAVARLIELTGLIDADKTQNRATIVSDNPTSRIDYILYSPHLKAIHTEVISTLASDHLPVLADLDYA